MTTRFGDRSGKVKISFLIWLLVIGGAFFSVYQYGRVYFGKYKLEEMAQQELSYAGQRTDESIRQRLAERIAGTSLPPAARGFRLARTESPRALQFTVGYVDTVNLVVTKKPIRVSVRVGRVF